MKASYDEWLYCGPKLKFIGSGIECQVFEYSDRMVLKTYNSRGERDRAFKRQKAARRDGFAPPTFGKLDYKTRGYYGYLSGRAEVLCPSGTPCPDQKTHICYRGIPRMKLARQMKTIGCSVDDLHDGNIGLYRNKWVVIDFGDASTDSFSTLTRDR